MVHGSTTRPIGLGIFDAENMALIIITIYGMYFNTIKSAVALCKPIIFRSFMVFYSI